MNIDFTNFGVLQIAVPAIAAIAVITLIFRAISGTLGNMDLKIPIIMVLVITSIIFFKGNIASMFMELVNSGQQISGQ